MRKYEISVFFLHDNSSLKAKMNILILWRAQWSGRWRSNSQLLTLIPLFYLVTITMWILSTYLLAGTSHPFSPLKRNKTKTFLLLPLQVTRYLDIKFTYFPQPLLLSVFPCFLGGILNAGIGDPISERAEEPSLKIGYYSGFLLAMVHELN